jgi:selenide,water dikinase
VRFADTIDDAMKRLLLDPQTSGGLLVGVPAEHAAAWDRARGAHGVQAWRVGEATAGHGVTVV